MFGSSNNPPAYAKAAPPQLNPRRRKTDLEILATQYAKAALVFACTLVLLRVILMHVTGHDLLDTHLLSNRTLYGCILVASLSWVASRWDLDSIRELGEEMNRPLTPRQLAIAQHNGTLSPSSLARRSARSGP